MIIVSCTQKNRSDFWDTPLSKSLECLDELYSINKPRRHIFFDNKIGMSTRYNETIDIHYEDHDMLFVHDDVLISDIFFEEKLKEGFEKYDVIGVAGSRDFSASRRPICWHNSPRESWAGSCYHPVNDKEFSFTNVYDTSFGRPGQVSVIDGLFIAISHKALDKGLRFNSKFDWDFYDLALCINANRLGLKIGVIPIALAHYSHGAGIMKPSYKISEELFLKEYSSKST